MTLQEKIQKKAEGFGKLAPAFLEGAKFVLENQWVSVDDDLPCNHDELIITNCYYDGKETINVITINKRGVVNENFMIFYDNKWEWGFSTAPCYWMPIPELPKEQEIKL